MQQARWSGQGSQSLPRYPCVSRSGNYEVRWTERDPVTGAARTRAFSFRTKDRARADAEYRAWLAAANAVKHISGGGPGDTLTSLADQYLSAKRMVGRPAGKTTEGSLDRVLEVLGSHAPTTLTDMDIEQYVAQRRRRVKGPTVRRELGALTAMLNWGKRKRIIPRNADLPLIELPEEGAPRQVVLSEAEVEVLWTAAVVRFEDGSLFRAQRRVGLFVCLALETAARAKSIEKLRVDQVDLAVGIVDFRDLGRSRQTKKRRVPVPISDRLRPVLARATIEAQMAGDPFVVAGGGSVRRSWGTFRDSLDIPPVVRHDLRRTWATLRARRGVPMDQIAAVLGDSVATTAKHYAHLDPDYLRAAVNG